VYFADNQNDTAKYILYRR